MWTKKTGLFMHWERVLPRHEPSKFTLIGLLGVCLPSMEHLQSSRALSLWIFLGFASATCLRDVCMVELKGKRLGVRATSPGVG